MQRNFNVTGEQRKQMVQIISREVGMEPIYMRMPTCAYAISNITVGKNGEMVWDGRTDEAMVAKVMDALAAAGFTPADPEPGTPAAEHEAEDEGPGDDGAAGLTVEVPRDGFTDEALANLRKIVDGKASLLKKSLGAEDLPVEVTEDRVRFPWFRKPSDADEASAYTHLVSAICHQAKTAKRVTATDHPVESEKYAFRTWLLRLGFVGAQFKRERSVLMRNLSGHAAFRNRADAEAFYEKVKARKAGAKAGTEGETAGETPDETVGTAASES